MLTRIKEFIGIKPGPDYHQLLKEGGIIVDVRNKSEYSIEHIKGSINIPLQNLKTGTGSLKDKDQPIITCCASGMRSAAAKTLLRSRGYTNIHNGGGWSGLISKIA